MEQEQIDIIRTAFENMQSREDFLHLLNEVKPLVYGEKTVPFDLKQLTWYSNPKLGRKRYTEFKIKKKSGTDRSIHAPVKGLKALQKTLSLIFQCIYEPHNAAMGFVRNKSIVDNAKVHAGKIYVYNIDLKDFFSSVDQARVWKCLQLKPFNLNNTTSSKHQYIKWGDFKKKFLKTDEVVTFIKGEGHIYAKTSYATIFMSENLDRKKDMYIRKGSSFLKSKEGKSLKDTQWLVNHIPNTNRQDICNIIASLCCTEMQVERKNSADEWELVKRNVLPQGAPTSPVLTNIICQRLDFILTGVAKRFHLNYSRYADDITFSSMHNVYQPDGEFLIELHRVIAEQGFHIKESKTRLQKEGYRKEVTGLLVNEKANVQHRYIKQLRMWLYYWERYGSERANSFFLQQYMFDKKNIIKGKPNMVNVIGGKLDYLKMVKGFDNELYLKLKERFDSLTSNSDLKKEMIIETLEVEELHKTTLTLFKEIKDQSITDEIKTSLSSESKVEILQESIPIFHHPKNLVNFLKNFSINNTALKYTTHSWDAGRDASIFKDLSEFLVKANEEYHNFSLELNELNNKLNGKIYNFLFNKEISKIGWGDLNFSKRIKFGWSSPELLEACKLDPSLNPEDFILPEKYQLQRDGKTIQKFKHVIDVFKNQIEIRDENSALINLILLKHDKFLIGFDDPIVKNLDNKTFYTDVQWLSKALDMIFENIQNRPQHRQVIYSINDEREDAYILEILHIDSFNTGKSIYDEKLQLGKGNFGDISEYLKNICDWSIESQFKEGCYRINYLTSDPKEEARIKKDTTDGFKYILTFYK